MLTITGLKNFCYIPGGTDMRRGYFCLQEIVKNKFHRDPYNGDVFIFISKHCKKVKMMHFEDYAYYIHEKCLTNGYRFMKITYENNLPVYKIKWKDIVVVLESSCHKDFKSPLNLNAFFDVNFAYTFNNQ